MNKINITQIKTEFKKFNMFSDNETYFDFFRLNTDEINAFLETFSDLSPDNSLSDTAENPLFIGVFKEDKPIGFAYAKKDMDAKNRRIYEIDEKSSLDKSIIIEYIYVLPEFRGKSLQKKLIAIFEYLYSAENFRHFFFKSPVNNYFLTKNTVDYGFEVIDIFPYGETDREFYYLCHFPVGKVRYDVVEQYAVHNMKIEAQKEVLSLGFCGFKAINYRAIDDYFLSYSIMYYD